MQSDPMNIFFKNKTYLALGLGILIALGTGSYATYKIVVNRDEQSTLTAPPEEIKGKVITLRALKEDYFVDMHNMFSQTVRKNLEFPASITLNWTIQYLHHLKKQSDEGKSLLYCIFDNKDNKVIGDIDIREPNDSDPGQFGGWVNENYWGGGRWQEATELISKTYFRLKPKVNSFIAHVRIWNKRSYHALKKSGFQDVGYFYEDGRPARYILEMKRR